MQTFNELNKLSKQKYVSPFSKAVALIGRGDRDATFAKLEKAYEDRSDTMAIINVYPLLENVRDNSRLVKIQRQISTLSR